MIQMTRFDVRMEVICKATAVVKNDNGCGERLDRTSPHAKSGKSSAPDDDRNVERRRRRIAI